MMKKSTKPTEYLLVRASTNSEWDTCEFAIIHITEQWKQQLEKRVAAIQPFKDDYNLQSMSYYDTEVDFYTTDEDDLPDMEGLLDGKDWAFVELAKSEQDSFALPENRLDCYRMIVYRSGAACYQAYGKHSGEEFFTADFSLTQLKAVL